LGGYERLEENFRIEISYRPGWKTFWNYSSPAAETIMKSDTASSKDTFAIVSYHLPPQGGTYTYCIATSYLNFLVTKGLVLMASYWKPGRSEIIRKKDEAARKIIQDAFPNRKIIQINVEVFNEGMGGIRCATQQQPVTDGKK
jgi:agmatine/peptidylarginine deiminase